MLFLNRKEEMSRLDELTARPEGGLAVIYGRRRIGKTRLLLEWAKRHDGLYSVADQSSGQIQRRYFAESVGGRFDGFAEVEYPDWRSLLTRLAREARQARWRGPVIFDELPYLVLSSPELPSVLQRWIDHEAREARLVVAVAGFESEDDAGSRPFRRGSIIWPRERSFGASSAQSHLPQTSSSLQDFVGAHRPLYGLGRCSALLGVCRFDDRQSSITCRTARSQSFGSTPPGTGPSTSRGGSFRAGGSPRFGRYWSGCSQSV